MRISESRTRSAGLYLFLGQQMTAAASRHQQCRESIEEMHGIVLGGSYAVGPAADFAAGRPIRVPVWVFGGFSMQEAGIRNPLPQDRWRRARTYLVSPNDTVQPIEEPLIERF